MTPSGIELATFWLEAQCLNQTRHHVPPNTSSCRKFTDRSHLHLKNRYYRPGVSHSRSQWSRGLRRGSAADLFLGLRVRIPLSVACCYVEVSAMGRSVVQRTTDMYVRACVSEYDKIHPQWVGIKGVKNKKKMEVFLRWHIDRNSAWNARLDSQKRQKVFFSQKNSHRSGAHPVQWMLGLLPRA